MYLGAKDLDVMARCEIEAKIVEKLIDTVLAAGFSISIDNGGDGFEITDSKDRAAILDAMMETDEENVFLVWPERDEEGHKRASAVYLVYGNDGWDVICDYNVNLQETLKPVFDYTETFEDWSDWPSDKKAQLVVDYVKRQKANKK